MLMRWVRVDSRRMSSPPLLTRDGDRGTGEQWAIFFRAVQALPQPGKVGMWQLWSKLQLVGRTRGRAAPGDTEH